MENSFLIINCPKPSFTDLRLLVFLASRTILSTRAYIEYRLNNQEAIDIQDLVSEAWDIAVFSPEVKEAYVLDDEIDPAGGYGLASHI